MALDRRNYRQVVETTEELANRVGVAAVLGRIVDDLKDDSEPYRRMVMETTKKVLENLGGADVDARLEERLVDGVLYAFQEQAVDSASLGGGGGSSAEGQVLLDGFGTVVQVLGQRAKPYLKQIAGTIKWRLNNKAASVRMQAADLIGRIAVVMKACGEEQLMGHLGVVLYEYLGEEYPDGALRWASAFGSQAVAQRRSRRAVLPCCACRSHRPFLSPPRSTPRNSPWLHFGGAAGHRECDRDDEDDPPHPGPAAAADPHSAEPPREGAGELH